MTIIDTQQPDQAGEPAGHYFHPNEIILMVSADRPLSEFERVALYQQSRDTLNTLLATHGVLRQGWTIDFAAGAPHPENRPHFDAADGSVHFLFFQLAGNADGYAD